MDLENLKYTELQKLAKRAGIKANMKVDRLRHALQDYYNQQEKPKSEAKDGKEKSGEKIQEKDHGNVQNNVDASSENDFEPVGMKLKTPARKKVVAKRGRKKKEQKTSKARDPTSPKPKAEVKTPSVTPKLGLKAATVTPRSVIRAPGLTPQSARKNLVTTPKSYVGTPKTALLTPQDRLKKQSLGTPKLTGRSTPSVSAPINLTPKNLSSNQAALSGKKSTPKSENVGGQKRRRSSQILNASEEGIVDEPQRKKRRSTFEVVPTPELPAASKPDAEAAPSPGQKSSEEKNKGGAPARTSKGKSSISPGVQQMLGVMTPGMEKEDMKKSLMSAIDKKVQDKLPQSNSAVKSSNIPRFAQFLAKKREQAGKKPVTPGNKNWEKIHKKEFEKFDSIDVYLEKKRKRTESVTTSVKKARLLLSEVHEAVNKLKNHKTPTAQCKPKIVKPVPPRNSLFQSPAPFKPTVVSTKNMNLNFTEMRSPQTVPRKSPRGTSKLNLSLSVSAHKPDPSSRKSTGGAVPRKSQGTTPFRFNAPLNTTFNDAKSAKKQAFDLQASLSRPLTWKPHTGKLKPLDVNKPRVIKQQPADIKAPKLKTKDDHRALHASRRAENKLSAQMANRKLQAH